ncbi:potassium-transporting ATPase subunit C [Actinosynnema sp. NPDC047251]|uniref:Potassium-transporting ATPase KdpC subunit n=1 Tax=Saccharothrix espanaensis (strain ATCC 51144 / DSM 44229 / JCM 9112 / NBRC 15066 / NRRL 15764) TaxID=1179773 RepID=K0K6N4_SACES|nr:potassium-transporting ATPase subunit C [Saccharothrix espanaensis]CCH33991.1 Potassium-transporting ATPase [Saccharothrix espanaensis DSM 44229]
MTNFAKQALAGLRVLLVLTVITGVLYPTAVWAVSRLPGLHANAEAVDTTLVGIDREGDEWFHTRPSTATLPASGGSNKSERNADYDTVVAERRAVVAQREGVSADLVPQDAYTASASGLDPHISPAYAELQVPRVARVNGLGEDRVRRLVTDHTDGRGAGILGEPGVNVTALNRALEALK